jgi:hypothetical protein
MVFSSRWNTKWYLSLDHWTSKAKQDYSGMTAHYIDDKLDPMTAGAGMLSPRRKGNSHCNQRRLSQEAFQ